jgi:hypothetical protein
MSSICLDLLGRCALRLRARTSDSTPHRVSQARHDAKTTLRPLLATATVTVVENTYATKDTSAATSFSSFRNSTSDLAIWLASAEGHGSTLEPITYTQAASGSPFATGIFSLV